MVKNKPELPTFGTLDLNQVVTTLTEVRLSKYLKVANDRPEVAMQLYVMNSAVSAAFLVDIHYVEVMLRNKFASQLTEKFGLEWFKNPEFLKLINQRSKNILEKAQRSAQKHWVMGAPLPTGKVIAELAFGFWCGLTDRSLEHTLWVSCLHKTFFPQKTPKRSVFNLALEQLRQLRNRIAHHEPIFHRNLNNDHDGLFKIGRLLCTDTANFVEQNSTVRQTLRTLSTS
jgi:hypothetical protein